MADVTPAQKSRLAKIFGVIIAVLAGATGADAAGLALDTDTLKQLGGGGTIMLILYLEVRCMPVLLRIVARDKREAELEEKPDLDAIPLAPSPALPNTGRARIAVVRPKSVVDE